MEYIKFDELRWINKFLQPNLTLTKEDMEQLKSFTFMWDMFEAKACKEVATAQNIATFVLNELDIPKKNREASDIDAYFVYFKNRYVKDGKSTEIFEKLSKDYNEKFTNNIKEFNCREFIFNTLTEKNPTEKNKILSLLLIIYRIRENFYVRESQLIKVKDQYRIYAVANNLIAMILNKLANKDI